MIDEYYCGERIKKLREEKGISTNKLANGSGVSQSYLRELENGIYLNPSVEILNSLCFGLGISLKEFFDEEVTMENADDLIIGEVRKIVSKLNIHQKDHLLNFFRSLKL